MLFVWGHPSEDTNVCALRLVTCRFCGDMVQAGSLAADTRDRLRGLLDHESHCESRTTPCDSCGRVVMLKEMGLHQVAVVGELAEPIMARSVDQFSSLAWSGVQVISH